MRELVVLAAVTDLESITPTPTDGDTINPAYVADLEFRLQQANSLARMMAKRLNKALEPSPEDVLDVVNRLESLLRELDRDEALGYIGENFRPEYFANVDLGPDMTRAIKGVLVKFCEGAGMKPIYSIWSDA